MAMQSLGQLLYLPEFYGTTDMGSLSTTSLAMNGTGQAQAIILQMPKTGTLDKFEVMGDFQSGLSNGMKFSFQDVSLSGVPARPDGTADQYRVVTGITNNTWVTPGLMTSDGTDGGDKRTVTAGELLACVIEFQSFTSGDVWRWRGATLAANVGAQPAGNFPLFVRNFSGWTAQSGIGAFFALKYDDGEYFHTGPYQAIKAFNSHTPTTATTPDEYANRFVPLVAMRAVGVWLRADLDNACDLILYDDSSTVLAAVSVPQNLRGANNNYQAFYLFSTPVTLTAGEVYRIAAQPTTASSIALCSFDVQTSDLMQATPMGTAVYSSSRTDGGAWTDLNTRRLFLGLVVDQVDDGVGGGGLLSPRSMCGGIAS